MAEIIVFGANGQLGRALQKVLPRAKYYNHSMCDVTQLSSLQSVFQSNPDVRWVINATAFTKVDLAETQPDAAYAINATAVSYLADLCNQVGATLIHISTDYVFDGCANTPYVVSAQTNPQSVYGKSKLLGEQAAQTCKHHYVIRTSWLYGDGKNFVNTMLSLGKTRDEVMVVDDQYGLPTIADDLALFCAFITTYPPKPGMYHFCNGGEGITWARFAQTIFELAHSNCRVVPVSTEEYIRLNPQILAPRPHYSVLDYSESVIVSKASDKKSFYIRGWYAALSEYINSQTST